VCHPFDLILTTLQPELSGSKTALGSLESVLLFSDPGSRTDDLGLLVLQTAQKAGDSTLHLFHLLSCLGELELMCPQQTLC
jgi:hypothetical protein